MDKPQFVYVTYIATTPEQLWDALTSEEFTQKYWGGRRIQSDWQVGSPVKPVKENGDSDWEGEVLESDPRIGFHTHFNRQVPTKNSHRV